MDIFDDDVFKNNAIERDGFDDDAFERSVDAVPELGHLESAFQNRKHGQEMLEDLHVSLLRPTPELKPEDGMDATVKAHRLVLSELMATSDYQKWHGSTQFDVVRSALGVVELGKAVLEKLPADVDERRRVLRDAIKSAQGTTEEKLEAYAALCGRMPGEGSLSDLGDVVKAGAAVARSTKAKRIMEIAGRMGRIAKAKHRARVRHGPDEIVDIEVGCDLTRVLPSELAYMSHPILKLDFMRRFCESELMQFRIEGREPSGRGPIVVMIDTSMSMRGEREFWAKGIALGLMAIALEEKREFAVVIFSDVREVRTFHFPKPDIDTIIKAIEFSFDGGTDFESPLNEGLKIIEASKFKKADLIMLTDGECHVSDAFVRQFNARKKEKGARLFSILIGFNSCALSPISDGIERIDDLTNDEAITDMVFAGI